MPACELRVTGDVLIAVPDDRLLVARVKPPRRGELRALLEAPTALSLGARTRWVPRWNGPRLSAIELQAHLATVARTQLTVRFTVPAHERTLAQRPTRIVLVDAVGWDASTEQRSLRRGVMLPAGSTELLGELLGSAAPAR